MATKAELVKQAKALGVSESEIKKANTNSKLEKLISDAQPTEKVEVAMPAIDMEAMKAQLMAEMRAQMMAEMKAEALAEVKAELADSPVEEEPKKIVREKMDHSELVPVMNITNGQLVYLSKKTGAEWNFEKYGDIEYMEVGELLSMRTSQPRLLNEPWVLVSDERAVNYLGLDKLYDKLTTIDNVDSIFTMKNDQFKEVVKTFPRGVAHLIVTRAKELIAGGELDSVAKINILKETYDIDF